MFSSDVWYLSASILLSKTPCYSFDVFVRYNPTLQAVVTVTEELAYEQAKEADKLLSQGVYLGMLSIC